MGFVRAATSVFAIALLGSCHSGGDGTGAVARARVAMVQGLGGKVDGELAAGLRLKTPTMEAETATSREIEFR